MNKDEEERAQAGAIHGLLFGEIKYKDGERLRWRIRRGDQTSGQEGK